MWLQTACGLRNGFEYTVQLQMETTAMKLVLHEGDQRLVHAGDKGMEAFRKAHFDWVTEAGSKERRIVVSHAWLDWDCACLLLGATHHGMRRQAAACACAAGPHHRLQG